MSDTTVEAFVNDEVRIVWIALNLVDDARTAILDCNTRRLAEVICHRIAYKDMARVLPHLAIFAGEPMSPDSDPASELQRLAFAAGTKALMDEPAGAAIVAAFGDTKEGERR